MYVLLVCRAESRSDHGVTRGEYKVALPDGRVQLVRYTGFRTGTDGYTIDIFFLASIAALKYKKFV